MTTQPKRQPAAALVLRAPAAPLTHSAIVEAIAPLVDLLQVDLDEVLSLTVTPREVRVHLVPSMRGKPLHNARVRASWPITADPDPAL